MLWGAKVSSETINELEMQRLVLMIIKELLKVNVKSWSVHSFDLLKFI